jgi:predicted small integral membrane protein
MLLFMACLSIGLAPKFAQAWRVRPRRCGAPSPYPGNEEIEMMAARYAKIVMTLALASFAFMVTFNNITDYNSNFAFVQHVLSMDTTFPGNAAMYRAVTLPTLWHAGYWVIIAGEGITCVLFLIGAFSMWRAREAPATLFERSKKWVIAGATVGFLVWFFGFMVVGGEWFLMWQSKTWNGQDAAFKFYMAILGVLIFINQPDR